jgi:hypothetical protein
MAMERAKDGRVTFERGLPVQMLAIDGSWSRPGTMDDVSQTGAKLTLAGAADEAALKEFFLLLSSGGLVYRRCELAWVDGEQIGVTFIHSDDRRTALRRRGEA